MNRSAKASYATYQKINRYYGYKYGTDGKIIDHIRTWYGMKIPKDKMLVMAKNQALNGKEVKREYYDKLFTFIAKLTDDEMKDINKYWARIDSRLLI